MMGCVVAAHETPSQIGFNQKFDMFQSSDPVLTPMKVAESRKEAYSFQPNDQNGYTPIDRASISKLPRRAVVAKALARNLPSAPLKDRDDVKFLQQTLIELGLMDAKAIRFAAGNYGERTTTAVAEIQSSLGRKQTGMYDNDVRAYLLEGLLQVRDRSPDPSFATSTVSRLAKPPTDCTTTLNYTDLEGGLVPRETLISDARPLQERGDISLQTHGFTLAQDETILTPDDFYYNKGLIQTVYYKETEELIKRELGADRVFVFAHQVRNSKRANDRELNSFADGSNVHSYASVVHTDFSGSKSAEKFYRVSGIPAGVKVRYVLINTWRNINEHEPVYNDSLACLDASSIHNEELVRVDELLKPGAACKDYDGSVQAHRECAEQYRLSAQRAQQHRWFYYPHMTNREVLIFKQFDSDPELSSRFTFHSFFNDQSIPVDLPPRESVETRAIAIFIEEDFAIKKELSPTLRLEREPLYTLQSRLAARAARGLLSASEVEGMADRAALLNIPDEVVLQQLVLKLKQSKGDNTRGVPRCQLYPTERSKAVLHLQFVLIELGLLDSYAIKYDGGTFGLETTTAVKRIQKYIKTPSNGVYDDNVRAQLLKMLQATEASYDS
jgi:peptidoglycan hydrolase-like protein with peptidoglycan-binding domain